MAVQEIQIRALGEADWPAVRAIYLEGIATDQATFETEAPAWEGWNATHLPAPRLVAVFRRYSGWLGGVGPGICPTGLCGRG